MESALAYISGVIDGEGTLVIGKYNRYNRCLAYRGFLAIVNTNIPMLIKIKSVIGGKIVEQVRQPGSLSVKRCYSLTLTTNVIRQWLPQLVPHLVAKRDQAEVLLAFLERQASNASAPISDELLAFYESCYVKLKELKKKEFSFKEPVVSLGMRLCKQCGKEFEHFSNRSSHKLYCSNWCKRKTHWTRSNRRIALGLPAWQVLQPVAQQENN